MADKQEKVPGRPPPGQEADKEREERKRLLVRELEECEKDLIKKCSQSLTARGDVLSLIKKAKQALNDGNLIDADIALVNIKSRIAQAEASQAALEKKEGKPPISLFWRIFIYDLLLLLAASALLWLVIIGPYQIEKPPDTSFPPTWLPGWLILAFAAGMLGGVLISLTGLARHKAEANFDTNYLKWYWCKPFIGGLSGAGASLPFLGGILAFEVGTKAPILVTSIAIIAFLVGYYERFFLELVDRVGEVILRPGDKKKE